MKSHKISFFLIFSLFIALSSNAKVALSLESVSEPRPMDSHIANGRAFIQIFVPDMILSQGNISGNISIDGDFKKIVGGYEFYVSTKNSNGAYINIVNPTDAANVVHVPLTENDNRNFFQKIFKANPSTLKSDKKYIIQLSVDGSSANLVRMNEAQLNPNIPTKYDKQNKPVAAVSIFVPGYSDQIVIAEENGLMVGEPMRDGTHWLVWVAPKKKGANRLIVRSSSHAPVVISSNEPLVGGKQYEATINYPQNSDNVNVDFSSNIPCSFTFSNANGESRSINLSERSTTIHLPYGAYTYQATADGNLPENGSFIIGNDKSIRIDLSSEKSLVNIKTEGGNTIIFDDETLVPMESDGAYDYYSISKKVGKYTAKVVRNGDLVTTRTINVMPRIETNEDLIVLGTLNIKKPKGANATIQHGVNNVNAITPYSLNNAFGEYLISGSKYGYESGKPKKVFVKAGENVDVPLPIYRAVTSFKFISYSYSPSAPIGIMFGRAKKWGWYVSIRTSVNFWKSAMIKGSDFTIGVADSNSLSINNAVMPEHWSDYNINTDDLQKRQPVRLSLTAGIMKSITWWMYMYAGVGYGHYKTLYENPDPKYLTTLEFSDPGVQTDEDDEYYADKYFSTYNIKSVEADLGLMFRFGHFNAIVGWTQLFGKKMIGEPCLGIGYNF